MQYAYQITLNIFVIACLVIMELSVKIVNLLKIIKYLKIIINKILLIKMIAVGIFHAKDANN